ncbi:hypothetical protein C1646_663248 [Rhizophagus diaphanus]|nr:hypothetical protein C1646_663248 [Rhizophagus diaphanus] [Rhizophagus sp. MUCL 43196]
MSMSDIESMSNDCSDSDKNFLKIFQISDNEVCFDNTGGNIYKELDQPKNMNNLSEFDQENVRNPAIDIQREDLYDSNKITNGRTQNKCSYCNNKGHIRATCLSNLCQNKKNDE